MEDCVMKDATMGQGKGLFELLLQADDPYVFVQNLIERWGAVQLIGRGEVTQAELIKALQHIETTTNLFSATRREPAYFIPADYQSAGGEVLAERLRAVRPTINLERLDQRIAAVVQHAHSDGVYAIPSVSYEAKFLGIKNPWDNFGALIEEVGRALASGRRFTNYRAGNLGADRYRLTESAKSAQIALEKEQPGDLLVFPAQTGKLFAGYSPRSARWDIEHASSPAQWTLPAYIVGWILFANPHRLEKYEHLIIDCPGDEYRFGPGEEYRYVLYFGFGDEKLYLGDRWDNGPSNDCGSGSGFVQQ